MFLRERCLKKRAVYKGSAVDFYADRILLPNGKKAVREYLSHPGAVAVAPFVDSKTILLVRQFRYPVGQATYEIPAGKLERGENPIACVRRELEEETGHRARQIRRLISYWPTPAFSNEILHIYAASQLHPVGAHPDEDEFLQVIRLPFNVALRWALTGKIRDSKTVIALLALKHFQ